MTRYRSSGLQPQPFAEQHGLKLSTQRRWIQQEGYSRLPNAEPRALKNFFYPVFLLLAGGPLKSSCPMGWWCT
jgi:hypothetical protein